MKKLILLLFAPVLLFSCRKADVITGASSPADTIRHAVKFTVDDLTTTTKTMSTGGKTTAAVGDTIRNYANYLYYSIFNSQGLWVKDIKQNSRDAQFGTIYDLQTAGKYLVYIAASKDEVYPTIDSKTPDNSYYRNLASTGWPDFFAKAFQLTVGSTDVNQAVRLDRVMSAFRVVVEDAIPEGVAKISVQITRDNAYYYFTGRHSESLFGATKNYSLTSADKGLKNKAFEGNVGNTNALTDVVITAYNGPGEVVAKKTLRNIQFEAGKRSIITGNLFTPVTNPTGAFTVTADPTWTFGTLKF
jgi:hypothetical protein